MKKSIPLIIGLGFFVMLFVFTLVRSLKMNGGNMIYSLDDAYIHMAMAKNFAEHGVWGVTRFEFTSCSSSIVWTLMLAGIYKVVGVNEITPFILNILSGIGLIYLAWYIWTNEKVKKIPMTFLMISLVFISSVVPLIFTGLEHTLHIVVSLGFVYLASLMLAEDNVKGQRLNVKDEEQEPKAKSESRPPLYLLLSKGETWAIVILAGLLPMLRYEGVLIALAAGILFLMRRKYLTGAGIIAAALIPIFIYGLYSVGEGWSFFPNSLLLKAGLPDVKSLGDFLVLLGALSKITFGSLIMKVMLIFGMMFLFVLIFILYKKRERLKYSENFYLITLVAVNFLLYAVYSRAGWSYRYQSFLFALVVVFAPVIIKRFLAGKGVITGGIMLYIWQFLRAGFVLILIIAAPIASYKLLWQTPRATNNIYEQQYKMGRFVKEYYNGKSVALNDIGAVNFLADVRCYDMWGLGTREASEKMRALIYTTDDVRRIAKEKDVSIAIVYLDWFDDEGGAVIPSEWVKCGEWKTEEWVIAGDDKVSFYAVKEGEAGLLIERVKGFR